MEYILVKMECNWADEFDIKCLWATTISEFDSWKADLLKRDISDYEEIYYGTNEFVSFSSFEDIMESLKITKISKSFYEEFINNIGKTFGLIDINCLGESYSLLEE